MPFMTSLRKFVLATKSGHMISFNKGENSFVSPMAIDEALAAGCVLAEGAEYSYDDSSRAKVEFSGDLRRSTIYSAMASIAKDNDAKNFDGGGTPKAEVVSERTGFSVHAKETDEVYKQYLTDKSDGNEPVLHPQTQNVARVVESTSKAELVALGVEFGEDEESLKALTAREIRKQLLGKFSGRSQE